MSENLDRLQSLKQLRFMPVWLNPLLDDPALVLENPRLPTAEDYAAFFRTAGESNP